MVVQVIIVHDDSSGWNKLFVVLENEKREEVIFAGGNPVHDCHGDLRRQYENLSGLQAKILGGGWLFFNKEGKTIQIGGSSSYFGCEPNRKETLRALEYAHPDFEVKGFE